ncbi:MAG: enoyl-ACP reductase [Holosporales bacterium]|jgi:enoyl-[acyl-carrier protein] reductase I|nr:enoyl-ACP reductase [Holosporales bacterium]
MIMEGKKGIIMGLANKFSIAYGIAESLKANGAELLYTVANDYFKGKISEIVSGDFSGSNSDIFICDVSKNGEIERCFEEIKEKYGEIDFIVHSIAFSDKNELKGRYIDTTRANFLNTLNISCFSFTETCKVSEKIINPNKGGSIVTLSYYGARKVFPSYNVMGIAKSALESSVLYAANDLGKSNIRVNAVSAGPIKTLASSGVGGFSKILESNRALSPLKRNVTLNDVGDAVTFLTSDMSSGITGEILYVDCGCNIIGVSS